MKKVIGSDENKPRVVRELPDDLAKAVRKIQDVAVRRSGQPADTYISPDKENTRILVYPANSPTPLAVFSIRFSDDGSRATRLFAELDPEVDGIPTIVKQACEKTEVGVVMRFGVEQYRLGKKQ